MPLSLYYDLLSQPSRSAWILLKKNKASFESKELDLMTGEHKTEEFKKMNPFTMVPCIKDDDFFLVESVAVLKYLIGKYKMPGHWYPSDLKSQARVEEYLRWYPTGTRKACVDLFLALTLIPKMSGKPVDQDAVKENRTKVTEMVGQLETYFLKEKKYIGGDKISIADLLGVCELVQLYGCHEQGLYESSTVVKGWVDRVKQEIGPLFDESMVKINHMNTVFLTEFASK